MLNVHKINFPTWTVSVKTVDTVILSVFVRKTGCRWLTSSLEIIQWFNSHFAEILFTFLPGSNLHPNSYSSPTLTPSVSLCVSLRFRCNAELQRQQSVQHHPQPVVHLQGNWQSGARVWCFPPGLHTQHLPQWVLSLCVISVHMRTEFRHKVVKERKKDNPPEWEGRFTEGQSCI